MSGFFFLLPPKFRRVPSTTSPSFSSFSQILLHSFIVFTNFIRFTFTFAAFYSFNALKILFRRVGTWRLSAGSTHKLFQLFSLLSLILFDFSPLLPHIIRYFHYFHYFFAAKGYFHKFSFVFTDFFRLYSAG